MIYVECLPDQALVTGLGISPEGVEHSHGKSDICQKLQRHAGAKGLVDEDPSAPRPSYLIGLQKRQTKHDITVLDDPSNRNMVLVLSPRLEEWVAEAASKAGVSLESYDFPVDPGELHKVVNHRIGKFQKLIHDLRKKSSALQELERLLRG